MKNSIICSNWLNIREMVLTVFVAGIIFQEASAQSSNALPAAAGKIPACMVIDDGTFAKLPTSFYRTFGEWAVSNGVKGKFSVVPCWEGKKAIDGSLGEYAGHTREERLEWIELIKTLYMPRWTITPEIITHSTQGPWDIKNKKLMAGMPKENLWLAQQSLETQTEYIAESMQFLKNVGLDIGGLTMCWSYPAEKNHILGDATLRAAEKVYGAKFVMIFNDPGEKPAVIYKRDDGAQAVSIRPSIGDIIYTTNILNRCEMEKMADKYITADGTSGKFVEQVKKGICLIFYTHDGSLYSNGSCQGLEVLTIAIERLRRFYGDKIEWMTGLEICRRFAE